MAYTPVGWQTGDTITAEKLNKMDNGWAVEGNTTVYIDNASVTTNDTGEGECVGPTPYASAIADDSITVVFNGTTYTCPKGPFGYGATENGPTADFTDYPFGLIPLGPVLLQTATAGTYTLTVSASVQSVEVSENFNSAVNTCVDTSTMPMECVSGITTGQDMYEAYAAGRIMFFKPYGNNDNVLRYITGFDQSTVYFIPEMTGVTAVFDNGVFTVTHN